MTLTNDNLTAKVYLWNDDSGFFSIYANVTLANPIVSIINGRKFYPISNKYHIFLKKVDLDDNGDIDLLLTVDVGDLNSYTLYFFKQNRGNSSFDQTANLTISRNHPTIVDVDGNHQ